MYIYCIPYFLQCVIINKSDEIVAGAGAFCAKSSSIINYTRRIVPFQAIIKNIKKLQYNTNFLCNYENMNKLFYQKNNFNNDFISISNRFASLQTVCYWKENIRE